MPSCSVVARPSLLTVLLTILALAAGAAAQNDGTSLITANASDVGRLDVAGSSTITGASVGIRGAGADIWGEADAFHFVHGSVRGDVAVTVRVDDFTGPHPWGKAGILLRSSTDPDADYASVLLTVEGRVTSQFRSMVGGDTTSVSRQPATPHRWLRLVRTGNTVQAWFSADGERWRLLRELEHLFPGKVEIGLGVTSHQRGELAEATFTQLASTRDLSVVHATPPELADLRLHVTADELEIWRERAERGPYRVDGDASANSPGDWRRIETNAQRFLENPTWRHWRGNTGEGCYERRDPPPHDEPGTRVRDAAFYALVTDEDRYREAVRDELVSLAAEPGTDFGDASRWCTGRIRDINPGFEIANWFTKMLFAYDYLGADAFTDAERASLDRWFLQAGHFFERELDFDLSTNFVDRLDDDYRLSEAGRSRNRTCSGISHYGGWEICSLAMYYNNRRATYARFVGLVGIKMGDELLQDRAKRFAKEWIRFSMYPDGVVGEFERWIPRLPDLGWDYASVVHASVVTLADHFARQGDTELYEYRTTDGHFGTQSTDGSEKSLLRGIRNLQSYLLPSDARYATRDPSLVGDPVTRIDGYHEPANWYSAADVVIVPANLYYQDSEIREVYARSADGVRPYPENLAQRGPELPWTGDWGIYPGVLFMYGGLEGAVYPYP